MVYRTKYGSYKFVVMPFELCNFLIIFTTLMNLIIYRERNKFMVVYINDILVFSKNKRL